MAIDINKKEEEYNYYYTSDGNQYGPLNLVQLISKINGETLVWREGIEWTNANNLEELKKFFPIVDSSSKVIKKQEEKQTNKTAEQRADMYIATKSKYYQSFQLSQIREKIAVMDDSKFNMLQSVPLKDPQTSLILSLFVGVYGVDRFYIGDTGIGIGKLLTCGGLFVWTIIDWFQIQSATRNNNFQKIQPFL
jgi:TM2 domain-containing membrane protein YozV